MRQHEQHPRRVLRAARIEVDDAAVRNRRQHHDTVADAVGCELGGVARGARRFLRSVGAIEGFANRAGLSVVVHATPPATRAARMTARCASATLKLLLRYG